MPDVIQLAREYGVAMRLVGMQSQMIEHGQRVDKPVDARAAWEALEAALTTSTAPRRQLICVKPDLNPCDCRDVCKRADGVPSAIEASAQTRNNTVGENRANPQGEQQ